MKVALVSRADIQGGAARASYRLHRALQASGHSSRMWVGVKRSSDPTVLGPEGPLARGWSRVRPGLANSLMRLQGARDANLRSPAIFPSGLARSINRSDAEVVNLHWIGEETLSVAETARLRKPVVWTLHDMWPFCGAEHYAPDGADARWRAGYESAAQNSALCGLDLDRWVWKRKKKAWRARRLIAPSRWLAQCARGSALMRDWPVTVVPNVIDTEQFRPSQDSRIREALGLPATKRLLLFSAVGGTADPRKGWDLLVAALQPLASANRDLECLVLGQDAPGRPADFPLPVRWMGEIRDDTLLAGLYSTSAVAVVPSRQDNLPLVATEAQACGCPVAAFAAGGLPDAVEHGATGYLAQPFDAAELAKGIGWILADRERHRQLREQARERAVRLWSAAAVVPRYLEVFAAAAAPAAR